MRSAYDWLFPAKAFAQDSDLARLRRILDVLPDERLLRTLESTRVEPDPDDPEAPAHSRPKSPRGDTKRYSARSCWYVLLTGIVFRHKYLSGAVAEFRRNSDLRELTGIYLVERVPSKWAMSRFLSHLILHAPVVDEMFDELVRELKMWLPDLGAHLGIDSSKMHTDARGKSDPAESADVEAGWGVKTTTRTRADGGTYEKVKTWFGYKLHLLIDTVYELPLAYVVSPANEADNQSVLDVVDHAAHNLDRAQAQREALDGPGSASLRLVEPPTPTAPVIELDPAALKPGDPRRRVSTAFEDSPLAAHKAYDDTDGVYTLLYDEYGIRPVIALREIMDGDREQTVYDRDRLNQARHPQTGQWHDLQYLGFEKDRATLKYACPCEGQGPCPFYPGRCNKSRGGRGLIIRIKLSENRRYYTPIARGTKKWQREYNRRSACERVFGRMKDVIDIEDTGLRGLARAQMRGALGSLILVAHAVACLREGRAQDIRSLKRA